MQARLGPRSLQRGGRAAARVVPRSVAAVAMMAVVSVIGRRSVAAALSGPPAGRLVRRQALDDAVAGKHTTVDGEIAANHKSAHGRVLLGQAARLVRQVRLILPTIDQNQAGVAVVGVTVALVHGVLPPTSPAKAFQVLHVEAAHLVN
jgi:hypothetical protein